MIELDVSERRLEKRIQIKILGKNELKMREIGNSLDRRFGDSRRRRTWRETGGCDNAACLEKNFAVVKRNDEGVFFGGI